MSADDEKTESISYVDVCHKATAGAAAQLITNPSVRLFKPEDSDWLCELWPGTAIRPLKGCEPTRFHRWVQRFIFGFRWTNTAPKPKRDWLGRIRRDHPFDPHSPPSDESWKAIAVSVATLLLLGTAGVWLIVKIAEAGHP